MSRTVFEGDRFKVSHTIEADGRHATRIEEYYGEYFTITALIHGNGKCFVEGNCYNLNPGDIIILRANELRRFSFGQGGLHERISVYISPSVISPVWNAGLPLLDIFKKRPPGVDNKIELTNDGALNEIKARMNDFTGEADEIQQIEMQLSILQLLTRLYSAGKSMNTTESYDSDPFIRKICFYIHENLGEKLTYDTIMETCSVSRYQLGEIFRHSTGMTLTEYIIQKRLIRVSELVFDGMKLENAAFSAGFNNYSHFYKMFIKYKGVSPKQYFNLFRNA